VREPRRTVRSPNVPVTVARRARDLTLRSRVSMTTVAGPETDGRRGFTVANSNSIVSTRCR
jgi:hypothetical protein